jgi:hypothetical protein
MRVLCFFPHAAMTVNTGTRVFPYGVSEYSTRSDPPPDACREMICFVEFSQLVGERLAAGLGKLPEKLAETQRSGLERIDDHGLPFAVDRVSGGSDGTIEKLQGGLRLQNCAYWTCSLHV